MLGTPRGQYIVSQALVIAADALRQVEEPHTEVSNIEDMEILLELFPIYVSFAEAQRALKLR